MAAGAIGGGIVGGVLQGVAPFITPQNASTGGDIVPQFDPFQLPNFVTAQNDAARLLGGPGIAVQTDFQNLLTRIRSLPISNKIKRRAIDEFNNFRAAVESGDGDFSAVNENRLQGGLKSLGITRENLADLIVDSNVKEKQNKAREEELRKADFSIQKDRQAAAAGASALLGDVGRFVKGGDPGAFQTGVLDRLNQNLDEQETNLLLRSNFGGFQPGAGLLELTNARQFAPQTALEQALAAAAGLTSGLGGGLQLTQGVATAGGNAQAGAASLAAQQAQAANAIRASQSAQQFSAQANGIAAGGAAIGSTFSNAALINALAPGRATASQGKNKAPGEK